MPPFVLAQIRYPHRMNKDGTIDSICPRCYATIGTSTWEADLERIEAAHICEPARLSYFDEQRRKPVVREGVPSSEGQHVVSPWAQPAMAEHEPALHV